MSVPGSITTTQASLRGRTRLIVACCLLGLAIGWAIFVHLTAPILPEDDAYITYRYVKNLYAGDGLVYNVGERVYGSSTPLYTAWLIVLRGAFPQGDIPTLAVRLNVIWYVGAALGLMWLVAAVSGSKAVACLAGAVAAASPAMLDISLGGMEPFLFASLALVGLAAMTAGRIRLSAALVGLSAIARPEGLLVGAVWGIWWLFRVHQEGLARRDMAALALAALPLSAWVAWSTLYYGTPVPHSVVAKNSPLYLVTAGEAALTVFARFTGWSVPSALADASIATAIFVAVLGLASGLWVVFRWKGSRRRGPWVAIVAALLSIAVLYSTRGVRLFEWYLPLPWLLWLAIMTGAAGLLVGDGADRPHRIPAALLLLLAAAPTLYALGALAASGESLPFETPYRTRILAYRQAAERINELAAPGDAVMASEIGALGYYYEGYVYDTAGLVSPAALPYLPIPLDERPGPLTGAVRLGYVQAHLPEFIMAMPGYTLRTLNPSDWFAEHYTLVAEVVLPMAFETDGVVEVWRAEQSEGR